MTGAWLGLLLLAIAAVLATRRGRFTCAHLLVLAAMGLMHVSRWLYAWGFEQNDA